MKKVFNFISKNRKKLISILIIILILLLLCFRLGFITPSKTLMIKYFKRNKDDFVNVVSYIKDKHENNIEYELIDFGYLDLNKVLNLKNKDIICMLYFSNFERICDYTDWDYQLQKYSDKMLISFYVNNFHVAVGEPIAIVYSDEKLSTEREGDWDTEYEISYEKIDNNWYLEYRSY